MSRKHVAYFYHTVRYKSRSTYLVCTKTKSGKSRFVAMYKMILCSLIPGFDFDLDEVWAPLNPHLRGFRAEASTSSSASSSDNSLHGRSLPMQSSSVLGDSSDTRASTARLPGRGKHSEVSIYRKKEK